MAAEGGIPATEGLVFDREGTLQRLGDDAELLALALNAFNCEASELLAAVREAIDTGGEPLVRRAHSLKGAALSIGAMRLAGHAEAIELGVATATRERLLTEMSAAEEAYAAFRRETLG